MPAFTGNAFMTTVSSAFLSASLSLSNPFSDVSPDLPPITTETYAILRANYLRQADLPPPPVQSSNHFLSTLETANYLGTLHDKYTRLLTPKAYTEIQKYDLTGLGILLQVYKSPHPLDDVDEGYVYVSSPPLKGGPAEEAGVASGDIITEVNGKSIKGMTAMEVVSVITDGGDVTSLKIKGKGLLDVPRKFEFKNTVRYSREGPELTVKIPDFNGRTFEGVKAALSESPSPSPSPERITLDLRGNSGGSFQSAVDVAGLFVPGGTVAKVKDGRGATLDVKASGSPGRSRGSGMAGEGVRVLIDDKSASASEVLAGALRDNCVAAVQGDRR